MTSPLVKFVKWTAGCGIVLGLAALCVGCRGGRNALPTGPSPVAATLRLQYEMPALDGTASATTRDLCTGRVRVRPSWRGFAPTTLVPTGSGSWDALLEQVPVGRQTLRFQMPAGCEAALVTVNGLVLARGLGGGREGASLLSYAFPITVHSDGTLSLSP